MPLHSEKTTYSAQYLAAVDTREEGTFFLPALPSCTSPHSQDLKENRLRSMEREYEENSSERLASMHQSHALNPDADADAYARQHDGDDDNSVPAPESIIFRKHTRAFDASVFHSSNHQSISRPIRDHHQRQHTDNETSPNANIDGIVFKRINTRKLDPSIFSMKLPPETVVAELGRDNNDDDGSVDERKDHQQQTHSLPSPFFSREEESSLGMMVSHEEKKELSLAQTVSNTSNAPGIPDHATTPRSLSNKNNDPERRSNIMSEISKQLRESRTRDPKGKTTLFDKGGAAATALAAVASILGSAVLAAVLSPSEVIFTNIQNRTYIYNYCATGETLEARANVCSALRSMYALCCVITLVFDMLCLLATIIVAIGLNTWLTMAYSFFILSILSQTLALIAASWLAVPVSAAIAASVLLILFLIAATFFVLPGIALAWHFRFGMNKTLTLEKPLKSSRSSPPSLSSTYSRATKTATKIRSMYGSSSSQGKVIEGSTVLHWAAFKGGARHRLLLSVLLAAGESVDIPAQGAEGWTPLHIAAYKGNDRIVRQLIEAGANVEQIDTANGRTALHFAALKGHKTTCEMLLKAGCDPSLMDVVGNSSIDVARRFGNVECLRTILDFQTEKLNNELMAAVKWRRGGRMRQLLAAGAAPNSRDSRGTSVLTWACNRGFEEGVRQLLDHGADVNASNTHGSTPLIEACMSGNANVVNALLQHGADVSAVIKDTGDNALHMASRRGHAEVVESLLTSPSTVVDKKAVDEAAINNNGAVLRILLSHDAKVDMSLLQAAAFIGSNSAVKLYIDKGDLARDATCDVSALIIAAQEGHVDVVRTLLTAHVDPNRRDAEGKTALYWAAAEGHDDVAALLIAHGADVHLAEYSQGKTPLHVAASAGHSKVAMLLSSSTSTSAMAHDRV